MQSAAAKFAFAFTLFACFSNAALAVADVGGITLGMKGEEALKILAAAQEGNARVGKVNFTLTFDRAQNKSGSFMVYTSTWHTQKSVGEMLVGISPLTGTVWSITKTENPQGARPSLKTIADAASKFGKVNAGVVTNTEYVQRWMLDPVGKEMEWANTYDKVQNGGCFANTQAASIVGTSLWFPVQPTTTCATVYWVNAQSAQHDGLASAFSAVGVDIAAFRNWYQAVDANKQKLIDQEKSSAAKPQL